MAQIFENGPEGAPKRGGCDRNGDGVGGAVEIWRCDEENGVALRSARDEMSGRVVDKEALTVALSATGRTMSRNIVIVGQLR